MTCPNCGSERTRRGGRAVWAAYLSLIAFAVVGVLGFRLHAGLVGGIVLAGAVLANLVAGTRICLQCGEQWKG